MRFRAASVPGGRRRELGDPIREPGDLADQFGNLCVPGGDLCRQLSILGKQGVVEFDRDHGDIEAPRLRPVDPL